MPELTLPEISLRIAQALLLALVLSAGAGCQDANEPTERAASSRPSPSPSQPPPNVLLVTVDTLRPDFLGAYGATSGASPVLDALAAESLVFDRAIAASPRTVPSHASIMTSLYVREHSVGWVNGSSRLDGERTLAEAFQEAGYDTAAFVGNMQLRFLVGLDAGFDRYDDDLTSREANRPRVMERHADDTTDAALRWLAQEHDRPWFLWVHYQDPHGPYTPPAEDLAAIDLEVVGEAPLPILEKNRGEHGIPAYQAIEGTSRPSEYARRYAAEIHFFDRQLGRLLAAADVGEHAPVVLLTADHGESYGEEGWWFSHGFRTTPDQVHVPFLLRAEGLGAGRSDRVVHHVDIAPTLASLAGLVAEPDFRGVDVSRGSTANAEQTPRWVYADVGFETTAYRDDLFVRTIPRGEEAAQQSERSISHWSGTSEWESAEAPGADSLREIDAYLATEVEMAEVDVPSRAFQIERMRQLRALGYLEAGEEEERPPARGSR